jgi:hypothetical protein
LVGELRNEVWGHINCSYWRTYFENTALSQRSQEARLSDFLYLTIGYNPVLSQVKSGSVLKKQWYLTNGAYNLGVDLDIWITYYLGLSFSYEYTSTLSYVLETLYAKDNSVYLKYSKLKVGLIF